MRPVFQMEQGDVFSTAKLRKGFDDLQKLYGQFGYIDFVAEPTFEPIPNTDKIDLTLTFDEGKQFFVRRIDFSGNTDHARQSHPPRIADRRRRHLQHAPVGAEHSASEPARLF